MSAWQPNNSLGFPPPLVEHFCVVTWTLIKIWHNSSPARNSHNKSSHQGKLSSLRDVPWPRCYLHVFIYITVAHRGWAETKVPWHFTLCTHTKTLFLPQRAAGSQLTLYTTVRWLAQSPPVSSQTQNLPAGQTEQCLPSCCSKHCFPTLAPCSLQSRFSASFSPTVGSLVRFATHVLLPTSEKQPSLGHLAQTFSAGEV